MAPFDSPFGFEAVANFRLVAPGVALADGRRLKPDRLYRSAQMDAASAADVLKLEEMSIKTYIDLREPAVDPPTGPAFEYLLPDGWSMAAGQPRRLSCSISEGVQPPMEIRDNLPELADDDPRKPFWDDWMVVAADGARRFVSVHTKSEKPLQNSQPSSCSATTPAACEPTAARS